MNVAALTLAIRTMTLVETTHVTDAFILTLINQGLFEVAAASDWPWMQTSGNLSLAADTRTIALPAGFERAIALVDDDHDEALPFIHPAKFFSRIGNDTGNSSTFVDMWTIFGTSIYLSPIPSTIDADRLTLYYFATPTALTTGEPPFPAAYHMMLVEYVKSKIYEREEYYDQAEQSLINYARYLDDMISFYNTQVSMSPAVYGKGQLPFSGYNVFGKNVPWWPWAT